MRIAFYAPMKPPDHPVPSGDRRMANLLIAALGRAGHQVALASRLCSRDATGDRDRQARLAGLGAGLARRLIRRYRAQDPAARPEAWLTYHLYYKAPDWIGPAVARGLGIPYLIAEASVAPKRAGGDWDLGHRASLEAIGAAAAVIVLNPDDADCLPESVRHHRLAPFLDPAPGATAAAARAAHRGPVAARYGLDPEVPWIAAVAMMRQGDKLASYRLLAEALDGLRDRPWQLLIAGDGPARAAVEQAFAGLAADGAGRRVRYAGLLDGARVPATLAACDLFAWPAVREAYGMALLEAQAAGLPVVAGRSGGVSAIVGDRETGLLSAPNDVGAFRDALRQLLDDPPRRRDMGRAALSKVAEAHSLDQAATRLDAILQSAHIAAGAGA